MAPDKALSGVCRFQGGPPLADDDRAGSERRPVQREQEI